MVRLGYRYIKIFKKSYLHPFITQKHAYEQLSHDRQAYSNAVLEKLNIEVALIGTLPEHERVLYAINHRSLLDIIVMEHLFSRHQKSGVWIAKEELFTTVYGDFFKYSGCISVDIESGRGLLTFFKKIKALLLKVPNLNVYIFPEGERHKGDGILEFQSGAQKIAKANQLDVVPVFINDTLEHVFRNAPYKKRKVVQVHVGNIIEQKNLESEYKSFMKSDQKEEA